MSFKVNKNVSLKQITWLIQAMVSLNYNQWLVVLKS